MMGNYRLICMHADQRGEREAMQVTDTKLKLKKGLKAMTQDDAKTSANLNYSNRSHGSRQINKKGKAHLYPSPTAVRKVVDFVFLFSFGLYSRDVILA